MNLNFYLYLSLFLVLVGLFVFSLVRRKWREQDGRTDAGGPGTGPADSGPDDMGRGE